MSDMFLDILVPEGELLFGKIAVAYDHGKSAVGKCHSVRQSSRDVVEETHDQVRFHQISHYHHSVTFKHGIDKISDLLNLAFGIDGVDEQERP